MPTRNQSGKPEHSFQNPNKKRKKSGKRLEKVVKHFQKLEKRIAKEWETKRLVDAMQKCRARIKKFGLTEAQITK